MGYLIERQILAGKLIDKGIKVKIFTKKSFIVLDPIDKPENMLWDEWQKLLKFAGIYNQEGKCPICKSYLIAEGDLHHYLINRRKVQGNPNKDLIHHSYNVMVVHRNCHIENPKVCLEKFLQMDIFDEEDIKKWYENFPGKLKMPGIFD